MNSSDYKKGVAMLIGSAFFFSLMALFVRLSGDLPAIQKSFFRNLIAMFAAAFMLLRDGQGFRSGKGNLPFLIIRSFFGTVGILCNFYAIDRLVLADANILNKMSPFFAIIASAIFLKEKIQPYQMGAVITALIGAVFVIKPSFHNAALIPAIAGLTGGLGAGIAYTTVRYLGQRGERGPVIVFFFSAFSCLVCLPFMMSGYVHMSAYQTVMLICAGISASFGQFMVTGAYFHAPAKEISIYDYTAIIFSTIWGFLFFDQVPDILSITGYFIIFAAALYNFRKKMNS